MSYGHSLPPNVAYAPYMPANAHPGRRSAPPSVHVIAILQYVGGFAALVAAAILGYAAFTVSQEAPTPYDIISPEGAARLFGLVAVIVAVSGFVAILLGRKVQRGRQWARVLVLILSVLSLAGVAASIAAEQTVAPYALGLVYPLLCVVLLNTRSARSWFAGGPGDTVLA
jgi:hypothetical protein